MLPPNEALARQAVALMGELLVRAQDDLEGPRPDLGRIGGSDGERPDLGCRAPRHAVVVGHFIPGRSLSMVPEHLRG